MIANLIRQKFIWLLIGVTLVVFGNVLGHQLVWDDHAFIINQNHNSFPSVSQIIDGSYPVPDTGSYRPMRNVFYALTLAVFNDNAIAHHAVVVILHLIISVQVYLLCRLLVKSEKAAQLGALLFALHPLHTESINWVTAGYDLFFVVFYLAALILHLNRQSLASSTPWALLCTALAMFTNELALTLPLIILLIDVFIFKLNPLKSADRKTYFMYWVIAAIYWIIRSGFVTTNPFQTQVYDSLLATIPLAIILFGTYIAKLVVPLGLTPDHFFQPGLTGLYSQNHNLTLLPPTLDFSEPGIFIPVLVTVIWVLAALLSVYKKSPLAAPLWWVPITLIPVLRIVPLPAIFAERYAYLASVGFIMAVVIIMSWLEFRQKTKPVAYSNVIMMVLFVYAIISFQNNKRWQNDFTLWTDALAKNPESASATSALGVQYFLMGDTAKSLEYHRRAVQMNPYVPSFQQNYVSSLVKVQRYDEIIEFVNLILKTDAKNVNLHTILASTYDAKGDYQNAMKHYQIAYDLTPSTSPARAEIERLVDELDQKYQPVDLE